MARRRRRMRHRRGAVAAAMALAVVGLFVLPWMKRAQGDHDVSAASGRESPEDQPEMPDVVELVCSAEAIDVPVASIRPQSDGLHLEVDNRLGDATRVWVDADSDGWSSGRFTVRPGPSRVVLAAPPGGLTVGCEAGERDEQRQVELVDVDHIYDEPGLSCEDDRQQQLTDVYEVASVTPSLPTAARNALGEERIPYTDRMKAFSGYPDGATLWTTPMLDPVVRVVRNGDTVALVHVEGTPATEGAEGDGAAADRLTAEPPWVRVSSVEYCPAFVEPPSQGGSRPSQS